jgi:hypothetical protein
MPVRSKAGRFVLKSATERAVRSIRATDWTWDEFGFLADSLKISRADLLEQWVKPGGQPSPSGDSGQVVGVTIRTDREGRNVTHLPGLWDESDEVVGVTPVELGIAIETLNEALTLRANAGGAIKVLIREALSELTDYGIAEFGP